MDTALDINLELAKSVAKRYSGQDKDIQKEIWLCIVKHLLSGNEAESDELVSTITDIMNDSGGSLSIDDILELLPSFERMGKFKDLICKSLNKYSNDVRCMKAEIELASQSNTKLRNALSRVMNPTLLANARLSQCISCGRLINERPPISAGPTGGMMTPYYAFPTGNMYHGACLCREAAKVAMPEESREIRTLAKALASIECLGKEDGTEIEKMRSNLHNHIAMQDPFCGENVSRYVTKPFMETGDLEKDEWTI